MEQLLGRVVVTERGAAARLRVVVEVVDGDAAVSLGRGGVGRGRARGGRLPLVLGARAQPLDEAQALQRVGRVRLAAGLQRLRDLRRQLRDIRASDERVDDGCRVVRSAYSPPRAARAGAPAAPR